MTNRDKLENAFNKLALDIDKSLVNIAKLVNAFEDKYNIDISNDLQYKLDEVADMIQDNYVDSDVLED